MLEARCERLDLILVGRTISLGESRNKRQESRLDSRRRGKKQEARIKTRLAIGLEEGAFKAVAHPVLCLAS